MFMCALVSSFLIFVSLYTFIPCINVKDIINVWWTQLCETAATVPVSMT